MNIQDIIIEGSGIRVTTNDGGVYQGVFKFASGVLSIDGIPPNILELLFHSNSSEDVNKYIKYLLGDIKFALGINLLNVGDLIY